MMRMAFSRGRILETLCNLEILVLMTNNSESVLYILVYIYNVSEDIMYLHD